MTDNQERPMTVLAATDGSECAQVALDLVRSIHWPEGSVIHVVRVVEHASVPAAPPSPADAQDHAEREAQVIGGVASELTGVARAMESTGARIETAVIGGRPASAILDKAEAVRADLIVVGSRGHGTIGSMVLGSVSAEVADHAHCPVLVAREPHLTHVILGTDGSSYARTAEDVIRGWPIFDTTRIEVVTVAFIDLPWTSSLALSAYAPSEDYTDTSTEVVVEHQRLADEAASRLKSAGRNATVRVVQGDPAAELLRVASEAEADLIVVGTHGRTGLRRLFAGSVARNVMVHAPCSVLVVRETRPLT